MIWLYKPENFVEGVDKKDWVKGLLSGLKKTCEQNENSDKSFFSFN
jgi:hypothetical protein